jgi:hypothetical protein
MESLYREYNQPIPFALEHVKHNRMRVKSHTVYHLCDIFNMLHNVVIY